MFQGPADGGAAPAARWREGEQRHWQMHDLPWCLRIRVLSRDRNTIAKAPVGTHVALPCGATDSIRSVSDDLSGCDHTLTVCSSLEERKTSTASRTTSLTLGRKHCFSDDFEECLHLVLEKPLSERREQQGCGDALGHTMLGKYNQPHHRSF